MNSILSLYQFNIKVMVIDRIYKSLMVCLIILPFTVNAHPGHGDHTHDGFSVIHYFTEPEHIAVIVTLLVTVVVALMVRRRKAAKKTS